jgi:hypothetical protein
MLYKGPTPTVTSVSLETGLSQGRGCCNKSIQSIHPAALYGVVLLAGGTPQLLPIATLGVGSSLLGEYAYNAFENRL